MRRRTLAAAVAVGLTVTVGWLASPPIIARVGALTCAGLAPPAVGSVSVDAGQNAKFTQYGNRAGTRGWTGGDSTYSVDLPGDGGRLWLFSDSFLGPVSAAGTRPTTSRLPNQTIVREQTFALNATFMSHPRGIVPPPATGWYWLRQPIVSGLELQVPLNHFTSVSGRPTYQGTAIARFSLTDLTHPLGVVNVPSATATQWGSWVQKEGSRTYIYGTEDLGVAKYLKVARVDGTDLTSTWHYYRGGPWTKASSWTAFEFRAARLRLGDTDYGVSNELSVHRLGSRRWVLITMDTTVGSENGSNSSDDIVAYFACSPVGPFVAKTFVYDTPETGPSPMYGNDPDIYTYNPHSHPEYVSAINPGRLVISYNVNSRDTSVGGDLYRDVTIYRPRFIDVQFTNVS